MTSPRGEDNNTHGESEPGRSPAEEVLDYLTRTCRETFWDRENSVIVVSAEIDYWVPCSAIRHKGDITRWVHHLSSKNWCTTDHVRAFVDVACAAIGSSPYSEDDPKPARKSQRRK